MTPWEFVDRAWSDRSFTGYLDLGKQRPTGPVDGDVSELGRGRYLEFDADSVRHIRKRHGSPLGEASRGRVAVTRAVLAEVSAIVEGAEAYRDIGPSRVTKSARAKAYEAVLDGRRWRLVVDDHPHRNVQQIQTLYDPDRPLVREIFK